MFLKQKPEELEKLVIIAKIQSTESSNEIEGIRTTNTRLKQLVNKKQLLKIELKKKSQDIEMH